MDLASAYRSCARVARREARNFYYAFLSLPKRQRLAVYALYTFCREADDVADSEASYDASEALTPDSARSVVRRGCVVHADSGSVEGRREQLGRMRERLARAAAGEPDGGPDQALADAIDRFGVDAGDLGDVLTGMEIDLTQTRVETFDALRSYCYHAASAVGLATLPILNAGVPPTDVMREAAVDLGLGMQFVNILRDIAEDLDRDRIYLSTEEMDAFGVDEAMLKGRSMTDELVRFLSQQAGRAEEYLTRGRRLLPLLPRSGRRCPWLLAELYGRILARIKAANYDVFGERMGLSKRRKILLLLRSLWR